MLKALLKDPTFSPDSFSYRVLTSNRRGGGHQLWRGSRWVPLLGAIAGCHCSVPLLGAIAGVPLLGCHCWVPLLGCHFWVPLLGAIARCHCWGAIAGVPWCHCWVPFLGAIAGVPLLGCHCWVPLRSIHVHPISALSAYTWQRSMQTIQDACNWDALAPFKAKMRECCPNICMSTIPQACIFDIA